MKTLFPVCRPAGRRTSAAGFTLLETMVAVAIIAIVLLAVYRLQSQSLVMNLSSRFYTTAPLLAQQKLSELELNDSPDLVQPVCGEYFPVYRGAVAADTIDSELLGESTERLRRIDLTVSFNQGELEYSFRTYRFYPQRRQRAQTRRLRLQRP